jgi:mono/diheme cytochrome c family protein
MLTDDAVRTLFERHMIMAHTRLAGRLAALLVALLLCVPAPDAAAQSRGELLYTTHCLACHTEQQHWRNKRQVVDWPSLLAQVRLWQGNSALAWGDDDVDQVAQYLNDAYYGFAPPLQPRARPVLARLAP